MTYFTRLYAAAFICLCCAAVAAVVVVFNHSTRPISAVVQECETFCSEAGGELVEIEGPYTYVCHCFMGSEIDYD